MLSFPHHESVPLMQASDGGVFVSRTRIPLETVVDAYLQGNSAEEIVAQFDALELADVHVVIAYNQQAGLRERMLARRQAREGVQ